MRRTIINSFGNVWAIPVNTAKPIALRVKDT